MASDAENYRLLKQAIVECLNEKEHSLNDFRNKIHGKDVIIFLGNTRSGKSTLVNYVIGSPLEGCESGKMEFKIRLKAEEESNGPEIGQGSLSCTANPGVYQMKTSQSTVVVDPPGFEDNRGVVQDIINALCISQIKHARTVKFVLVFDINEITSDNIRNFTNSLQQVQDLVSNFDELKNSFSVVFTKEWKNYSQDEIAELFRNKILNQEGLDVDKVLVRNFAASPKFIGIFRMPTKVGDVGPELDVNLNGALRACHQVDVEKCQIRFSLSDKAKEALLEMYPEYTDTTFFEAVVNSLTQTCNNFFDLDRYVFASYDEELTTTKELMERLKSALIVQIEGPLTDLSEIHRSLNLLLVDSPTPIPVPREFTVNFNFVVRVDESSMLEGKYKEMIIKNYLGSLNKLHDKVDGLLNKIDAEFDERTKNKIGFTLAGAGSALGVGPAFVGAAKALECMVQTGSKVQKVLQPATAIYGTCEAAVGGTLATGACLGGAVLVGAGVGSAYVLYKQTIGKRKEARQEQGRVV